LIVRLLDLDLGEAEIALQSMQQTCQRNFIREQFGFMCIVPVIVRTHSFARVKADHHESANHPTLLWVRLGVVPGRLPDQAMSAAP
jgi:hypothetical protein